MNFKTTLVLLVLVAAVAALLLLGPAVTAWRGPGAPEPAAATGETLNVLEHELTPDRLTRIEVDKGGRHLVLERAAGGEWSLPGKWPTRQPEVEALVNLLTGLRSRFAPEPLSGPPEVLKQYGLDRPEVTVTVTAGGKQYRLAFAEKDERDSGDRFARPTYLRLNDNPEVVRLGPGLVSALDKSVDYYQQRRLFPGERVPAEPGGTDRVERLAGKALAVEEGKGPGESYTLTRAGDWELTRPVHDRADPDKLKAVLTAVPDVWAEQFVDRGTKPLSEFGLAPPEQTVAVTRPGGDTVTLLVGKTSPTVRERKVARPAPPGVPVPLQTETVREEFRYAKLKDNDQVFEVKADRIKELLVPAKDLRDARLARFRTEDARRLELSYGGQDVVLAKDKERWRLEKPVRADAETSKVNEVLDKLSALEARDADLIDKSEPKKYGFDDPAKVGRMVVTVEEEKGEGEKKTKTTRVLTFRLGKHDADKHKLYVQTAEKKEGDKAEAVWPRVNAVDDALAPLASRPALAYRGRRVLDFAAADLDTVRVERGGETVALKQAKDGWRLTAPVAAEADTGKAGQLAGSLGNLEAVEYVNDAPTPQDLDTYGLGKGAVKATLTFTGAGKRPAQTLLVGKERPGRSGEFFAKLESGPSVFVVRKDVRDALDQGSLAYRPLPLWQVASDEVTSLRVQRAGEPEHRLTRRDGGWKVGGPFDAPALASLVEPLLTELAGPRAERFVAHAAKDLKPYGLDAPHLRLTLTAAGKERTLLVGSPTGPGARTHYAKRDDDGAVFVVGDKLLAEADRGALDLLDRTLLTLDAKGITRVESKGGAAPLALQRKGEAWEVVQSPAPAPFVADAGAVDGLLGAWSHLQAVRFAAYGPNVEAAKYGLDRPAVTVTVTVQPPEAGGKKAAPVTHTLAIGKPVEGGGGERYARLDSGPGVAVLPSYAAGDFTRTYLDYVSRTLLKVDPSAVTGLVRQMGGQALDVRKREDGWQIVKPRDLRADDATLDRLVEQLASLRAARVAAYPAKDVKPFGLDAPAATITLDGAKPAVLKVGKPVDAAAADGGDRFAQVVGSDVVAVLPGALVRTLLADPLRFRDRAVARFADADRAVLERGPRKATFAKVDGTWKMTEPLEAEAEQLDLDDFVNAVARLRADELVAEKPADLKPFGLDRPEARWRFTSGAQEVLDLLVGTREKGGPRCYAKLAQGDLVFLLDPQLAGRVLGEYRKRAVWPTPPDAAQVEVVHFGYARDPFVLQKVDNAWEVAGRPGVKVSTPAVNDALAALAGLRVERYALDKGADLKLFGLEPPELVLEVQGPGGKQTLHVGHAEGGSKRRYAHVPGKERDVMVISEADAGRIVRDLAAFTERGDKPRKP
jgi:hypothetical protein